MNTIRIGREEIELRFDFLAVAALERDGVSILEMQRGLRPSAEHPGRLEPIPEGEAGYLPPAERFRGFSLTSLVKIFKAGIGHKFGDLSDVEAAALANQLPGANTGERFHYLVQTVMAALRGSWRREAPSDEEAEDEGEGQVAIKNSSGAAT